MRTELVIFVVSMLPHCLDTLDGVGIVVWSSSCAEKHTPQIVTANAGLQHNKIVAHDQVAEHHSWCIFARLSDSRESPPRQRTSTPFGYTMQSNVFLLLMLSAAGEDALKTRWRSAAQSDAEATGTEGFVNQAPPWRLPLSSEPVSSSTSAHERVPHRPSFCCRPEC